MSKEISNKLDGILKNLNWDKEVRIRREVDLKEGAKKIWEKCQNFNLSKGGFMEFGYDNSDLSVFLTREFVGDDQYSLSIVRGKGDGAKDEFLAEIKTDKVGVYGGKDRGYKEMKDDQQIVNALLDVLEENNNAK